MRETAIDELDEDLANHNALFPFHVQARFRKTEQGNLPGPRQRKLMGAMIAAAAARASYRGLARDSDGAGMPVTWHKSGGYPDATGDNQPRPCNFFRNLRTL